jgi:two-component system cell cycle sensor histidine kinase/response regulator CckA
LVGRFLDDEEFVKEAKGFSRRDYGVPLWHIAAAFIAAFCLITVSLSAINAQDIWLLSLLTFLILGSLLAVVCSFILKNRNIIMASEFQNAIFAGAAKLVTEFCIIIRNDGKIVYVDQAYSNRLFGNSKQDASVETLAKRGILNKKEKDKLLSALTEGKSQTINFSFPNSPNEELPLAFSIEPIGVYSKNENSNKLRLAVRPIERPSGYFLLKAPREEKIEVEDQKDIYLKKFSIGSYLLKTNGEFKEVNSVLEANLGYGDAEIIGLGITFKDLFYEEETAKKLSDSSECWQAVLPLRNKENMIVSCLIDHRVNKDKNGKILQRYGLILPFSSIKSGELDTSNGTDLITYSPIATATLDTKGNVQRSNKAFRILSNKEDNSERSWNLLDIISPEERPIAKESLKNLVTGKISGYEPIDIKVHGKGETTASLYISRIMDNYGAVSTLIAHLIDTTELKNLELRFVHSQKMQAVGQLAGGIAHDFNNLLTAMMGFCDLLLIRHPAGDQSFADIMQIKQNANRAANLVRQLLAFSRKQTLQPKIINITDVLADLSNLIGRLIGENIELKMMHGRDLGSVKVDQGQLEQVIINLAVNARDAMGEGGTLSIKTSNITIDEKHKLNRNLIPPAEDEIIENGEYVLIDVIDTGCGIEKEEIGKIFEPFYSTKEIGEGTGLGLSTVYGIIKQTDGYIYVSSKIGKGSKFSIFLKRFANVSPREIEHTNKITSEKHTVMDLSGKGTVLLVEDETPVRIFSNSALTGKGYTVLEAENAEVALKIVKDKGEEIDIIITDVVMPGMSGPDMVKTISKDYPDIKVVFISGYGEDAFIESFGEERKFHFLSKPYTLKQLATKVKEVLEEKQETTIS